MADTDTGAWRRALFGVVVANVILLAYGLFRPDSLDFSIPFLMAPSLALMGVFAARDRRSGRTVVLAVLGIVAGLIAVILINELTS